MNGNPLVDFRVASFKSQIKSILQGNVMTAKQIKNFLKREIPLPSLKDRLEEMDFIGSDILNKNKVYFIKGEYRPQKNLFS